MAKSKNYYINIKKSRKLFQYLRFFVFGLLLFGLGLFKTTVYSIPISDTLTITENPTPVFSTLLPDQGFVIKDNTNYKFYYAGTDWTSIRLAQSPDGLTWTDYSGNPIITDAQYHSNVKYYSDGFSGANLGSDPSSMTMNYRMWYQGLSGYSIAGWRYAESPNGINWYNRMPVSQFGVPVHSSSVGINYGIADAVYTPGASNTGTDWKFRIYANVQWESGIYSDGREVVIMAFSANGYEWTGYDPTSVNMATPIFGPTLNMSDFDGGHVGWFKVIKNSASDWEAFYSGGTNTTYLKLNGIGYAVSTDGINWTRKQTLFTTSDAVAWRAESVWMPSVVKTGSNSYKIWFIGSDNPDINNSDWIQWKLGAANLTKPSEPTPTPIPTSTQVPTMTPSPTIAVIPTTVPTTAPAPTPIPTPAVAYPYILLNDYIEYLDGTGKLVEGIDVGQIINFNVNTQNNTAIVKGIFYNYALLSLGANAPETRLNIGEVRQVDVNGDGINDIQVTLNSIIDGKANFVFVELNSPNNTGLPETGEKATPTPTSTDSLNAANSGANQNILSYVALLLCSLVLLGLLTLFIYKKKKKKK
jgi:hypothetical protein